MCESFFSCNYNIIIIDYYKWSHKHTALLHQRQTNQHNFFLYDFTINKTQNHRVNYNKRRKKFKIMDPKQFQIETNSDPNPSTDVYHLALDIGGNFHFFFLNFFFALFNFVGFSFFMKKF
jgi:hypothetical protein